MSYDVTKSQLEILQVMWAAGKPLSRGEVLELSWDKSWKGSSIHILLNGLLKKELIVEAGFARSGKVWGRLYAPAISLEEFYAEELKILPPACLARMLQKSIRSTTLSDEEIIVLKNAVCGTLTILQNKGGHNVPG